MACENDMKFKFQHPYIESCWNTAILIHVRIVYSCFHVMTGAKYVVETGTIWPTKPAMFPSWSFADKVGWSLHEKAEAIELNSLDYWSIPPQYLPPQEKNPQNWVSKGKKKKKNHKSSPGVPICKTIQGITWFCEVPGQHEFRRDVMSLYHFAPKAFLNGEPEAGSREADLPLLNRDNPYWY